MLIDLMPVCFACPDPATRWRLPGADKWGMDPLQNYKMLDEAEAYEIWETRGVPHDAYATCDTHFLYKPDSDGNAVLTLAGRREQQGNGAAASSPTRADRTKARKRELRQQVLHELGGKCRDCGEQDPALLRIVWPFPVRPLEASSPEQWYEWLLAEPGALGRCVCLCVRHPRMVITDETRAGGIDAAVAAYGGKCGVCGTADGPLWVSAITVRAPRYPGGRKMSSRDKLRWLAANGYPPGFEVRCPPCGRGGGSST